MKRFLLWLFMVIVFTGAIVGGSLAFLYYNITEKQLPQAEITLAGQSLAEPVGYRWNVPILGGVVWRELYYSPGQRIQNLEPITTPHATLQLAEDMTEEATTLELKNSSGQTVFSGTASEWRQFVFPQEGDYTLTIQAGRAQSDERPAKAYGWYQYQCRFTVQATPQITLSAESVAQGETVAVYVSGFLGDIGATPEAETDLGTVWFHGLDNGWIGYIGVPYNAPGGTHTITVQVGDTTLTTELSIRASSYPTSQQTDTESASQEANTQFRNKIYGFYTLGNNQRYWSGRFTAPVTGNIFQPYGAYLIAEDGSDAGRAPNVTYIAGIGDEVVAPAGGQVVFAESLLLTGNTVVIDHGCGVKSYLYHLQDIAVQKGDMLEQGQSVGHCEKQLIWEVRIGNKSVDPEKLTKTTGGLFYQPMQG